MLDTKGRKSEQGKGMQFSGGDQEGTQYVVGMSPGPRWGSQGMLLRDKAQADFGRPEKSFSGQQKGKEHPPLP